MSAVLDWAVGYLAFALTSLFGWVLICLVIAVPVAAIQIIRHRK